jgi:hypothetical protein
MQARLQEMMYRRPTHLRVEKNKGIEGSSPPMLLLG